MSQSPTHQEMNAALRDREITTERVINYVRAGVIISGVILDVVTAARTGLADRRYAIFALSFGAIIIAYLLVIHLLTSRRRYRPWVKYLTITADFGILVAYYLEIMEPAIMRDLDVNAAIALFVMISIIVVLESSLRLDHWTIVYGTVLATIGVFVANQTAGTHVILRIWSAPIILAAGAITYWVSGNVRRTVFDLFRRQRLIRFLPREVVELIENEDDDVSLGGKRCRVTVMFADIRSFTHYSEHRDPEDVVGVLNEYLTTMSEIILQRGGMIDKYVGDEVMAVFGAPVDREDDAERAVAAAQEMLEALAGLNSRWANEGRTPLEIGIALHSGDVVAGNVGSPQRMEYTVIGDTVNVASRVEALNKTYGTHLLITEETRSEASLDDELLRFVGEVSVRGREQPIGVYALTDGGP